MEKLILQHRQLLLGRDISVQEDPAVRRMIIPAVKFDKLLIGQIGNGGRLSPRIVLVGGIGKKEPVGVFPHQGIVRTVSTLHFVVNNPPQTQFIGFPDIPMPLLLKDFFFQKRKKHRIRIDPQQIEIILFHGAGGGKNRLVRIGHGIHERVHAALHHGLEGIFHGITA